MRKRKCEGKIYDQSIEYHWYFCPNDASHVHHKDRNHINFRLARGFALVNNDRDSMFD